MRDFMVRRDYLAALPGACSALLPVPARSLIHFASSTLASLKQSSKVKNSHKTLSMSDIVNAKHKGKARKSAVTELGGEEEAYVLSYTSLRAPFSPLLI